MCGEMGTSPDLRLQLAELFLGFLGQNMNNPPTPAVKNTPQYLHAQLDGAWDPVFHKMYLVGYFSPQPPSHWYECRLDEAQNSRGSICWFGGVKTGGKQQINKK